MKKLLDYLKLLSYQVKDLLSLKFFRLLVAVTFILLLTIIILISSHCVGVFDITLSEITWLLEKDFLSIIADGGMFVLSLRLNRENNPTKIIVNTLSTFLNLNELSKEEVIAYELKQKYGELNKETINNIIKQWEMTDK